MIESITTMERVANFGKLAVVTFVATSIAIFAVFLGMWASNVIA